MTNGRRTEVTRVTVVGINYDAFEHHLRVGHEDLERMKPGRADGQLHGEPAQVVEHFVAAELSGTGQSDARILTGERLQVRRLRQVGGRVFGKFVLEALTGIKRQRSLVVEGDGKAQAALGVDILRGEDADAERYAVM